MERTQISIRIDGPFAWHGANSVFDSSLSEETGIYLFTVPYDTQYLVYYVGETGRSFRERLTEHATDYLGGLYRIYDPKIFANGERELIWGGLFLKGRRHLMGDFLAKHDRISPIIRDFLDAMALHVIVYEGPDRVRQRIEAAIAKGLRAQDGVVADFQNDDIRYRARRADEEPVAVTVEGENPIIGLTGTFEA